MNNTCQACPASAPYYQSSSKNCIVCLGNTHWNETLEKCVVSPSESMCPPEKPVYNAAIYGCEPCPTNTTFHKDTQECVPSCADGYFYNYTKMNCQNLCKEDEFFNKTSSKCEKICKSPYLYDKVIRRCLNPVEYHHCNKNQNWDNETKRCFNACSIH